jgi:hypothetical protein
MSAFTSTDRNCPGAPLRVPTQSRINVDTATPTVLDFDDIPVSQCVTPQRPKRELQVPNAPLRPIVPAAVDNDVTLQVPLQLSPPRFERALEHRVPAAPNRRRQNTDLDLSDEDVSPPAAKRARMEFPNGPLMRHGPAPGVAYESDDNVSTLITFEELNRLGSKMFGTRQ